MLRLALLALIAIAVAMLMLRFAPRLRARVIAVARHPFVRQILFGLLFRLIRLLIFRRQSFMAAGYGGRLVISPTHPLQQLSHLGQRGGILGRTVE